MSLTSAFLKRSAVILALMLPTFSLASDAPAPPPSDWIPSGVEQLGRTAVFHTDFTFDRTMLQMAGGLLDGGDADTRKAIAKLNGISVHLYRYAAPGMYDPQQLEAIRQQYHAEGWKHLVSTQNQAAAQSAGAMGEHTDLYIRFQGMDVVGMVVMQTSPRNLNVVALNGDLSPVDLLHLRGHFGIPRFAGDGFAPAKDN